MSISDLNAQTNRQSQRDVQKRNFCIRANTIFRQYINFAAIL